MKSLSLTLLLVVGVGTTTLAQFGRQFGGFGPRGYPAKFAREDSFGRASISAGRSIRADAARRAARGGPRTTPTPS